MKQFNPQDSDDIERLKALDAKPWQIALLKLNPDYVHWAPGDDALEYDTPVASWQDFGPLKLDDWNELVNFHFSICRDSYHCPTCSGSGYHPDAQIINNQFYGNDIDDPARWCDKITDDEVVALIEHGHLRQFTHYFSDGIQPDAQGLVLERGWHAKKNHPVPTAQMVNDWAKKDVIGHDIIARYVLVQARLKRLGITEICPQCQQKGYLYKDVPARVKLCLWMIFPRKGASAGIIVDNITQHDIPFILEWLEEARCRNQKRFEKTTQALQNLHLNFKT
jgi:hypothetical protein